MVRLREIAHVLLKTYVPSAVMLHYLQGASGECGPSKVGPLDETPSEKEGPGRTQSHQGLLGRRPQAGDVRAPS